jgi:ubiquinone biosynthesis protein COQ4
MTNTKQHQEELLLSSFLDMVNAPDGDFTVLGQLAKVSSDQASMQLMIQHLSVHPQGKQAFANHFSLGIIDLAALSKLAKNTLGYLYAEHMIQNQLKPLQAQIPTNDQDFLGMHITETHDIWHVVTGSKTDMLGEIQLEAFYVAQLKMSRFWLALVTKNLLKSVVYDIEVADQYMAMITKGWTMGNQAKPLFGVNWNNLWETPIEQIRASFNILEHLMTASYLD